MSSVAKLLIDGFDLMQARIESKKIREGVELSSSNLLRAETVEEHLETAATQILTAAILHPDAEKFFTALKESLARLEQAGDDAEDSEAESDEETDEDAESDDDNSVGDAAAPVDEDLTSEASAREVASQNIRNFRAK